MHFFTNPSLPALELPVTLNAGEQEGWGVLASSGGWRRRNRCPECKRRKERHRKQENNMVYAPLHLH